MRIGDLVRFRSIGMSHRREELFIVMTRLPERHREADQDRNRRDVFKIIPVSLVGEAVFCYSNDVEVVSEAR